MNGAGSQPSVLAAMAAALAAGLPDVPPTAILMHMRTTIILEEPLLEKARRLTGMQEKTALVHAGLQALIARESARRLATLGKSEPRAAAPRRRRRPARRVPR